MAVRAGGLLQFIRGVCGFPVPARAVANVENPNGGGLDGEVDPVDVRIPALQKLSHATLGRHS